MNGHNWHKLPTNDKLSPDPNVTC